MSFSRKIKETFIAYFNIDYFPVGECKIDLVIILDDSGSICDNDPIDSKARPCYNWRLTLDFTKNVISKFNIDDKRTQIGLIKFSNSAHSISKIGEYVSFSHPLRQSVEKNCSSQTL